MGKNDYEGGGWLFAVDADDQGALFARLRTFLVETKLLESSDAEIYLLALRSRSITSRDVAEHVRGVENQTTASEKLKKLARLGFLEHSAGEGAGGVGKRGSPIKYAPIPPSIALKKSLLAAIDLHQDVSKFDEYLELGGATSDGDEVWLVRNEDAALGKLGEAISGASSEVLCYCRDASWWSDGVIRKALQEAVARKVKITVIGTEIPGPLITELQTSGIKVIPTKARMAPFFVVDRSSLHLPHETGRVSRRYGAIRIMNRYLVERFAAFVDHHTQQRRSS